MNDLTSYIRDKETERRAQHRKYKQVTCFDCNGDGDIKTFRTGNSDGRERCPECNGRGWNYES